MKVKGVQYWHKKMDPKTPGTEQKMQKQTMTRWTHNYDKSGAAEKWVKNGLFSKQCWVNVFIFCSCRNK